MSDRTTAQCSFAAMHCRKLHSTGMSAWGQKQTLAAVWEMVRFTPDNGLFWRESGESGMCQDLPLTRFSRAGAKRVFWTTLLFSR